MNQNNNTCMPCILVYILMFRTVTVSCGAHVCRGLQILTYRLLPTWTTSDILMIWVMLRFGIDTDYLDSDVI